MDEQLAAGDRLRLCFVVESGTDVRLVEGLAERFQLTVLARRIEGGVEISRPPSTPLSMTIGPPSRLAFGRSVARFLREREREFDAVLVQGYNVAALVANCFGRVRGMPTLMLVCSPVELYYRCRRSNPTPGKPFRRHELWGITGLAALNARIGQRYVALSEHLAQVVRDRGARQPVDVVPVYGVDLGWFRPAPRSRMEVRRARGLPESGHIIFFGSRVAPEKDSVTLLLAVRRLLEAGMDLWVLHRSGGYREFLRVAESLGIEGRVIATDAVHPNTELPLDYQASDVCVQASREEGLGFSPLEALACGTPVVATAVGGLRETIIEGATGWTYPVADVVALAGCIREVLSDPGEAARRTLAGQAMVQERYGRARAFDRLSAVVSALVGSARAPVAALMNAAPSAP